MDLLHSLHGDRHSCSGRESASLSPFVFCSVCCHRPSCGRGLVLLLLLSPGLIIFCPRDLDYSPDHSGGVSGIAAFSVLRSSSVLQTEQAATALESLCLFQPDCLKITLGVFRRRSSSSGSHFFVRLDSPPLEQQHARVAAKEGAAHCSRF